MVEISDRKRTAVAKLIATAKEKAQSEPVLIFISDDDRSAKKSIVNAFKDTRTEAVCIESEQEAYMNLSRASGFERGVIICSVKYARGFDIKFTKTAAVLILSIKLSFKASVIRQMVGRANRSQGLQHGHVFSSYKGI